MVVVPNANDVTTTIKRNEDWRFHKKAAHISWHAKRWWITCTSISVGGNRQRLRSSVTKRNAMWRSIIKRNTRLNLKNLNKGCQMYQRENNGLGCKVKTNTPNNDWSATSSINQRRGVNYAQCSSSDIHCVSNAMALAKSLTTSHPSSRVAIRWRGTTYKQCVIDVTI